MSRVSVLFVICLASAPLHAQVQRPRATTGPSAASLATPYSGPLKFDRRVLAQERAASHDANPITRGASWRYRYSSPLNYYWGCYGSSGYYGYGGYRPFRSYGGGTSLGWWGPY